MHTGPPGGTNSNLTIIITNNAMLDFLMEALWRHLGKVVIFPIGGVKVVFLNISCFACWMAFSMTDKAENIWVLCCEAENIST